MPYPAARGVSCPAWRSQLPRSEGYRDAARQVRVPVIFAGKYVEYAVRGVAELERVPGDRAFFPGRRLAGRGEEGRQGIPLAGGCHKLGQEAAPELLVSSVPCSPG